MSWTKQDAVIDGIYMALERWDREERRARDLRSITKADVRRVDRMPDGTRILTPRRSALARHLTDAALTAIREWEAGEDATGGGVEPPLRGALPTGTRSAPNIVVPTSVGSMASRRRG